MELAATFALPVALDNRGNLGVSVYNVEASSIEAPTAPLRVLDPQVEVIKDARVEVEVKSST